MMLPEIYNIHVAYMIARTVECGAACLLARARSDLNWIRFTRHKMYTHRTIGGI